MSKSKDKRAASRREFERGTPAEIEFEAWLRVFEIVRAQYPKVVLRPVAEVTGVELTVLQKAMRDGFFHAWCPGPIDALLTVSTEAELDDLRDELVTAALNEEYDDLPRYRLDRLGNGEYIGRGPWRDFGVTGPLTLHQVKHRPLGHIRGGRPQKPASRKAFSSGAMVKPSARSAASSTSASAKLLGKSSRSSVSTNSAAPSGPTPTSTADVVMPGYGPTLIQVNGNNQNTYTEADVQRLREAAERNGLDLGQFAAALRAAMLQEMELIATVRGEALANIKGFRSISEMMRRRMAAFARKLHEEEIKGFPGMDAQNPEKELRTILQFMEIQKRMGQIVGDVIESEQKRLGDAEAWRRRTDTLLFGSAGASEIQDAAKGKADRMPPEQLEDIANWLKLPLLANPDAAKSTPSNMGANAGTPTKTSAEQAEPIAAQLPSVPLIDSTPTEGQPITQRPGMGVLRPTGSAQPVSAPSPAIGTATVV